MASFLKEAKRGLRRKTGGLISRARRSRTPWIRDSVAPALCYIDMLTADFGIVRALFNNRHQISPDIWRSAQPAPRHIALLARRGVKTVINLRGRDQSPGTQWLEERACARNGVRLVNLRLRSRAAPTREELLEMRDALVRVAYPIAIHCKSGADRAGLMSAIARHVHDGAPIAEARGQLALRFGHIRQAETGVLGAVFDQYLKDNARRPIAFWDWVERDYDPDAIAERFQAKRWATRLVNSVLRRE
ncbi:MAG: fused DSP-PTPase phosphatase/NAD kinase-like protein [Hyphomicrobium sp.]